ncbi:hypothetical protein RRG08_032924 [Elysia crispata]|uniref:Uncharacterized protein n=1 Tax=Elysia crispata TaxID=231223 RepID=A0AAE1A8J7_9GAST|nr:hypothetical protein RRG08_032924 [Elysia crispata]
MPYLSHIRDPCAPPPDTPCPNCTAPGLEDATPDPPLTVTGANEYRLLYLFALVCLARQIVRHRATKRRRAFDWYPDVLGKNFYNAALSGMTRSHGDSIPDLDKIKPQKIYPSEKGGKTSLCGPENRRWMCESMRPTLGTSLIVFAVPLLLPGITLTAVGFDDNSSFAKYGALHIIGLTLLSLSGLLLLTGTFLNIRFHDKVSPEDVKSQAVSTHETKTSSNNQSRDMTVVSLDPKEASSPNPAVLASFMVDAGHSSARHDSHHVTFGESKVGAGAPLVSGGISGAEAAKDDQSRPNRDFELHSILSSPRNYTQEAKFKFYPQSGLSHSESIPSSSCPEHLSHQNRPYEETIKDDLQLKTDLEPTTDSNLVRHMQKALPEIRTVSVSTEHLAVDKENSSFETDKTKRFKKKKKRNRKTKSERLLDRKNEGLETNDSRSGSTSIQFSSEDQSEFLSLEKRPGLTTQTVSHLTREETGVAYRTKNTPLKQQDMDKLALPKIPSRKMDFPSSHDKGSGRLRDKHSSVSTAGEEEENHGDLRELPKRRMQGQIRSGVPILPPPSYTSLGHGEHSAAGIFASMSDSVGTVTHVYTMEASNSTAEKS